jgi:hypothetical protein
MFYQHLSVRKAGRVAVSRGNHDNVTTITVTDVAV